MVHEKSKQKKYMLHVLVHEEKVFSYDFRMNGVRFEKRETIETWYGNDVNTTW